MSLKCSLIVAYYIKILSYRDTLCFGHWFVCLRLSLFMSNVCDLLSITILTFFTINHIISLKQTNFVFGHFDLKVQPQGVLSFCLNLSLALLIKVLLLKKVYISLQNNNYSLFSWKKSFCKLFKLFYEDAEAWAGWPTKETK